MRTLTFPQDLLRMLWWIFFRPIALQKYIEHFDPALGYTTGLTTLWQRGKTRSPLRQLVLLALFHTIVTPFLLTLAVVSVIGLLNVPIHWQNVLIGAGAGVAFALICVIYVALDESNGRKSILPFGVAGIVSFAHAAALSLALLGGAFALPNGVVGAIVSFALGAALSVSWGITRGIGAGVIGTIACIFLFGVDGGLAFAIGFFRLWLYLVELPWSEWLTRQARAGGDAALFPRQPVHWDQAIWFPLYGLENFLVAVGKKDRASATIPFAEVAGSFRQCWAARVAATRLAYFDLEQPTTWQAIGDIPPPAWLPHKLSDDLDVVMPRVQTIARHVQQAEASTSDSERRAQLQAALDETRGLNEGLSTLRSKRNSARFTQALANWQGLLEKELSEAEFALRDS